jgi:hypothetical protein
LDKVSHQEKQPSAVKKTSLQPSGKAPESGNRKRLGNSILSRRLVGTKVTVGKAAVSHQANQPSGKPKLFPQQVYLMADG